jgi:hypothetical protein
LIQLEIGVIRYANDVVHPIKGYHSTKSSPPDEARSAFQDRRMRGPGGRGICRRGPDFFSNGPPPTQVDVGTREGQRYQQEGQDGTPSQGRNFGTYCITTSSRRKFCEPKLPIKACTSPLCSVACPDPSPQ